MKIMEPYPEDLKKLIHQFRHIGRYHGQLLDRATSKEGIYKTQFMVLAEVFHHPGISQKDLSEHMDISPPSLTGTVKRLEEMGYIRREEDEKDNRMKLIYMTPEGERRLKGTWKRFIEVDAKMFDDFSEQEMQMLQDFFDRMFKNLEKADKLSEKEETMP